MPPKFKRHLNDDEVTGSVKSERVSAGATGRPVPPVLLAITVRSGARGRCLWKAGGC